MTDSRLLDILAGREGNYLLPFYWQRGNHRDRIPAQVARIRASGCRALCVESRTHPDFCGEGWWRDMDVILAECQRLGMKVWILDDKHFPTGYANGAVAAHPDLARWCLAERHVDVMGPAPESSLLVCERPDGDEPLLGAFAQRRARVPGQVMEGPPVDLTDKVRGGILTWDVPEGCWRVFFVRKTRQGTDKGYIDFLGADSCRLLLDAVYEPHWRRYARLFGSVIAGFFSDEPQFGNELVGPHLHDGGKYTYGVGQEGLALPFHSEVLARMSAALGEDAAPHLGELWYESDRSHLVRLAYMDAATTLYRDNFSRPVGDWCRAHGVEYIGHVIEDMDVHARLGYGPGHYFRALDGQDMGGVDIVLHQVMPGFAGILHAASGLGGAYDPDFFHYVLAKLSASIAHQNPRMRGRALCEVFGAYGWAEGAPFMRWLLDFLLVRGVNHFVPHAFSPEFPDPDCPPHFGAEGHDPQFDGFTALMGYANKAAHLFCGARHVASAAILYHAEGEWMSGIGHAMSVKEPAKSLYDAHLDFDIVCADTLLDEATAAVENGRLRVGDETFAALVMPAVEHLPDALVARLRDLAAEGLAVLYVEDEPSAAHGVLPPALRATPLSEGGGSEEALGASAISKGRGMATHTHEVAPSERGLPAEPGGGVLREEAGIPAAIFRRIPLQSLPDAVRTIGGADVDVEGDYPLLRIYHAVRDGNDIFMLFNESPTLLAATTVRLPARGPFARLRLLEAVAASDSTSEGAVAIDLLPGQSEILVFGGDAGLPPAPLYGEPVEIHPTFEIDVAESEDLSAFRRFAVTDTLFNLAAADKIPDFSGKARYAFAFEASEDDARRGLAIDLGRVGHTARLWVNGRDAGIRVAPPYRFEIGALLRAGTNALVVETADTLARKIRDPFSHFLLLPPAGLLGPVRIRST